MHVDLITLYLLAIGTLFVGSGMTLWECRVHPTRSKELKILAAAYATLGVGCATAVFRHDLAGITGSALSNLVIVAGYLLIGQGVAGTHGRRYAAMSVGLLCLLALTWIVVGTRWPDAMWDYVSAIPIAVASAMTSRELLRSDGFRSMQSRHLAIAITVAHAVFYAVRATLLPWLAMRYRNDVLSVAAQMTMYEGVLYSVALPMTLLRLVREESHRQLLRESKTDYLTGLGNRRWFFEESAHVIRDGKVKRPVSLLAFDLDQFKTINDRYGHETGDHVLQSFSEVVAGVLKDRAILARIGGEEFAALLPGCDGQRARELGEAVIGRFASQVFRGAGGAELRATVSIGLAEFGVDADLLVGLLAAADRALYRAKSLGGNRLEAARRPEPCAMA